MANGKVKPLERILSVLKYERREISAIYFYAILSGVVQLSLPLGIQSIISFVLGGSISTSLVLLIVFVVFGTFIYGLLQVNQMKIIERIQQQLYVRYAFLYTHLLPRLDLLATEKFYLPECVNRYFDIMSLQKGISKLLLDVPTATIQILVGLILLSFYHPSFIFFGLFLILMLSLIIYITGNRGIETSLAESNYKYKMAAYLQQAARTIISLKFVNEKYHFKKADKHISAYLAARTNHFKILLVQYWTLIGLKVIITAVMLIFGAVLLINQQLNIGQFIATEIVIILVLNSVEKLIVNLDQVYDVITALEKINEVIELPGEKQGEAAGTSERKGLKVEVRNVSLSYSHTGEILRDVSFSVLPSKKIAVYGSSGSGKSTLMRLLSGLYKPDKGTVLLNDTPVARYRYASLRTQIGVVSRNYDILEGTILDNIVMGKEFTYEQINELTNITGLTPFIEKTQEGYDLVLNNIHQHLPSEILKKIALTRALFDNPKMLLLEYAFDNIPLQDTINILEYIKTRLHGATVVLITAREDVVKLCDDVLVLEKGVVKYYGPAKNLQDNL